MKGVCLSGAVLIVFAAGAHAAEPPASALPAGSNYPRELTGEYVNRLGQVRGQFAVFGLMNEICGEAFPELAPANDAAYRQWRLDYQTLITDIEQRWLAMTQQIAGGDPVKQTQITARFDARQQPAKTLMTAKMKERGLPAFHFACETEFAQMLKSDQANVERNYAEQLRVVRAGYGDHFVRADPARTADPVVVDGFKASEFPSAGAPAVVKLLYAGAEPRLQPQCRYQVGSTQQFVMILHMSIGMEMDGQRLRIPRSPGMQIVMAMKIIEANEGEARYEFSMPNPTKLIETDGVDPKLLESFERRLNRIPRFRGQATVTSRCLHKDLRMELNDDADPEIKDMVRTFRESMERIAMTLPDAPIGAGARWKALERFDRDGVTLLQVATITLEKLDGTDLMLQMEAAQLGTGDAVKVPGAPPGMQMQLVRMQATGRGTV
jgi:hypothetical protein